MLIDMIKKYLSYPVHSVNANKKTYPTVAADNVQRVTDYHLSKLHARIEHKKESALTPAHALSVSPDVRAQHAQQVAVINDALAITHSVYPRQDVAMAAAHTVEAVNTSEVADNVISLPEPMDPDVERLLEQFLQREKTHSFIKEQNLSLKYYLQEIKTIRGDLKILRKKYRAVIKSEECSTDEYQALREEFLCSKALLSEMLQYFQADKTRILAKREVYQPILNIVSQYHPRRATNLSREITVFIDKQLLLLEKMLQCYDKLMLAASGFLSRVDLQIETLHKAFLPRKQSDSDHLLGSRVLKTRWPSSPALSQKDWHLLELRKLVSQDNQT